MQKKENAEKDDWDCEEKRQSKSKKFLGGHLYLFPFQLKASLLLIYDKCFQLMVIGNQPE